MSKRTLAYLLLLATALFWGASFALVKAAFADANPLLFNPLRFVLAALALAILNRRHLRNLARTHLASGALAGLFLAAGYQFQTLGLARTTPTKSAFLTGLVVVFVPIMTLVPALRPAGTPRPDIGSGAGAVIAFLGLILLTTPGGTTSANIFTSISTGDLLTLLCAIAFAAHLLMLAHASRTMPTGLLATLQIAFAAVFMVITAPLEHPHLTLTPRLIVTLLLTALLGTAAAFTIQSFAQQLLPPTHTVLILTFEPIFAWMTSLLFFHEVLGSRALIGAALILAGITLVELLPGANATEIPA